LPQAVRVGLIVGSQQLRGKPSSELGEHSMALAFDDVIVSSIQFGVSFLDDAGPDLLRVFAFCKDKLVLVVSWQCIVHNHVNCFQEFVKPDHVCSFIVSPLVLS